MQANRKGEEKMEAIAKLKHIRISPRKIKFVLDLIRGNDVHEAMAILKHTPNGVCEDLQKLLKSACANAENNFGMDRNLLYVSQCYVTPGPTMKRVRSVGRGRMHRILKRTSHVTLVVKERE